MKASRFTEEQIIGILKQADAGQPVARLCREHAVSEATFAQRVPGWKSKYGGLEVNEARRLKQVAEETTCRKRLLADAMLDNAGGTLWVKDVLGKKW